MYGSTCKLFFGIKKMQAHISYVGESVYAV